MNKKPIIIIASILVLAACAFLFIRSKYLAKPEKKEVIEFWDHFNADLKQGNIDTLLNYFDGKQNSKQLIKLLGMLSNKKSLNGRDSALFTVDIVSGDSKIVVVNNELTNAFVPVVFSDHGTDIQKSNLLIRLRKISAGKFTIVQIDARKFIEDFTAYETKIRANLYDTDRTITYSPITLEAFKVAETLKSKYDSIPWFAHIDNKTFYYVVKGKWQLGDTVKTGGKMGLVNADLKEVIPTEFYLIYNISGTFPDLVEVEQNRKRGFYNLEGKLILPVEYDQIFPVNEGNNIAVLRKGDDYFYLQQDFTVSAKADINIGDILPQIKNLNKSFDATKQALNVITEYNSKEDPGAIYIAPSYFVDLNIMPQISGFRNPLRKGNYEFIHENYNVVPGEKMETKPTNWLSVVFYSIKDHFLGGRGDFYEKKNIVLIDKKRNRLFAEELVTDFSPEGLGSPTGPCDVSSIKMINNSLFEVKAGAVMYSDLYDSTKTIVSATYYHYLGVKNNKISELPFTRTFNFTKYVKMDDSYLNGCYEILNYTERTKKSNTTQVNHITPEMLRMMKNEIYADYRYEFKDKRWQTIFGNMAAYNYGNLNDAKPNNANVDDSLTAIDKYNINWINNKLKQKQQGNTKQPQTLAAAK